MDKMWEQRLRNVWPSVLEGAFDRNGGLARDLPKLGPIHVHRDREDGFLSFMLDPIRLHVQAVRSDRIDWDADGMKFTATLEVEGAFLSMDYAITREVKPVHAMGSADSMVRLFGVDAALTMDTVRSDTEGNLDLAREYKSKLQAGSGQGKTLVGWFDDDNDIINEILRSKKSVFAAQWPRKTTPIDQTDPGKGSINTKDSMNATSAAAQNPDDPDKKVGDDAYQRHSYYMEGLLYHDALLGKAAYKGPAPNPYDQLIAHIRSFAASTQQFPEPMTVQSVMSAVDKNEGAQAEMTSSFPSLLELSETPGLPALVREAYAEAHADAQRFHAEMDRGSSLLVHEPMQTVVTSEHTTWDLDPLTLELEFAYSEGLDAFMLLGVTALVAKLHSQWKDAADERVHAVIGQLRQMSFVVELLRERTRASLTERKLYDLLERQLNEAWRQSGNSE